LHPDVVACTLKRFEEELEKALATRSQGDADLRRQTGEIERGIANQLRALRDGYSPAITADLAKLEHQLASVKARLETSDPRTVKSQIRDTRRFVESRLEDLSALWDGEPRIAREEIAKHVGKITLKPMLRMYIATGVWDWLGVLGTAAAMVVPGARIELATPAFSGRRSTTELPRHVWFRNCMGCGAIVSIRSANAIYCEEESSKSAKLRGQDAPHQSEEKSRMAASSPHFWY
jgi:hypothetical protein